MKRIFKVVLVVFAVGVLCAACGSSSQVCPAYSLDTDGQEVVDKDKA